MSSLLSFLSLESSSFVPVKNLVQVSPSQSFTSVNFQTVSVVLIRFIFSVFGYVCITYFTIENVVFVVL